MPCNNLNNVFQSLQMSLESAMKVGGVYNYKLAHMGRDQLLREGRLPVTLLCSQEAITKARKIIQNAVQSE